MKYGLYRNKLNAEMVVTGYAFEADLKGFYSLGGIYLAENRDSIFGTWTYLVTEESLRESGYEYVGDEA